jgi:hypothetical protein
VPLLLLVPPVFEAIVFEREFAAFCAAENMDEKKPPPDP